MAPPTGMRAQRRKCSAVCLAMQGRKGRRVEGVTSGMGIGPRFCSSVPHPLEGSLTSCMQWQGLRAEMNRGHSACQLLHQVPGGHGKPTAVAPKPSLSPLQVASSMGKGKEGYMHLAAQREGATYQTQQPETHSAGLPADWPHSPVQSPLPLPTPTVQVGEEKGGHCALSLTLHQSYAPSTAG